MLKLDDVIIILVIVAISLVFLLVAINFKGKPKVTPTIEQLLPQDDWKV